MCNLAFVNPINALPIRSKVLDNRASQGPRRRRRPPVASNTLQSNDLFHNLRQPATKNRVNETVIFIHDFLTDARLFTPLINTTLLKPYTLLSYDMRGFGRSPDPTAPYSRSEDIHSLHPYPAHIMGSGLGGAVALEYALSHPNHVKSVSVIGSGLPGHRWTQKSFMDITMARTVGRFLDAGAHLQGRERDILQWKQMFIASNNTWDVLRDGDKEVGRALIEMARAYRGFHFFNHDPLVPPPMDTPPLVDRLCNIAVPVKVMVGDGDTEDFRNIAREICVGVPGERDVSVIEDAGHFAVMEKPDAIAEELVRSWEDLAALPPTRRVPGADL